MHVAVLTPPVEYTYIPTGVKVAILSEHDNGEYKMCRSITTGKVFYAHSTQIKAEEVKEEPAPKKTRQRRGRQVAKPEVNVQQAFARVNINAATPEMLTQTLKGIGMTTAQEIKDLQRSMPGERFSKLDQLKSISKVDWDAVLDDTVYVE